MVDSIHVARWIAQFDASEVEFTLFPSTPNRRVHTMIKDMMAKNGNIKIVPFGGKLSIPLWGMDLIFSDYVRGWLLRHILKRDQPDFVHALELQHGGYITSRALEDTFLETPFIATNYGSDIYWFQQFPRHLAKIKKLLARADRYCAECHRDVDLAKKYGFKGGVMPVFPNAGGIRVESSNVLGERTSQRKWIVVKGYTGWAGLADVALDAIKLLQADLVEYHVHFYSCSRKFARKVRKFGRKSGISTSTSLKRELTYDQMFALFAKARIYIAVSKTDGISTSMLEAMANGAFPIQSSTACTADWFVYGQSGFAPDVLEAPVVADQIRTALSGDAFVDRAAMVNFETLQEKLSLEISKEIAERIYT
jgi:glycosyltransferase involved in cell wall biosynthesis